VGSAEALHPDRPAAQLSHATGIPATELESRRERLVEHAGCPVVLFDQAYVQYYTSRVLAPAALCRTSSTSAGLFRRREDSMNEARVVMSRPVTSVDRAVLDYFDENGIRELWRQHTGHGIGLRNHEAPFLDIGDHTSVEPGMVFAIEPGVYQEGLGGFRHSDTIVVTEDAVEILTDYPRDLESLTISV
jgi:hypothetical protein